MLVHQKVLTYIQKSGLKQIAVAKAANIPVATFNAILHGKRTMYAEDLKAICEALGVSADVFISDEPA